MTDITNINIPLILQTNLVFLQTNLTKDRRSSTGLDSFLNFRFFRVVAAVHGIYVITTDGMLRRCHIRDKNLNKIQQSVEWVQEHWNIVTSSRMLKYCNLKLCTVMKVFCVRVELRAKKKIFPCKRVFVTRAEMQCLFTIRYSLITII